MLYSENLWVWAVMLETGVGACSSEVLQRGTSSEVAFLVINMVLLCTRQTGHSNGTSGASGMYLS